jgi:butyrate kinase
MDKVFKILALNPGSTSTKVSIYENEKEVSTKLLEHSPAELSKYKYATEQYDMRMGAILDFLGEIGVNPREIDAIAARGGPPAKYKAGAYEINDAMIEACKSGKANLHPISLSPVIAYNWSKEYGTKAYVYDVVFVDEITDVARISGLPFVDRIGATHTLNTKAVARRVAEDMGSTYDKVTFIMCQLGGGTSVSIHQNGRIVDVISKDEGTFSPVRAGKIAAGDVIDMCLSGKYTEYELNAFWDGKGGLMAHLGTNDTKEVLKRIEQGDERAKLVLYAMAYQLAKDVGSMAVVAKGKIDRIVFTGGMAHSKVITDWIKELVEFIAPVVIYPGTFETEALALGILRVLRGEEKYEQFIPGVTV